MLIIITKVDSNIRRYRARFCKGGVPRPRRMAPDLGRAGEAALTEPSAVALDPKATSVNKSSRMLKISH